MISTCAQHPTAHVRQHKKYHYRISPWFARVSPACLSARRQYQYAFAHDQRPSPAFSEQNEIISFVRNVQLEIICSLIYLPLSHQQHLPINYCLIHSKYDSHFIFIVRVRRRRRFSHFQNALRSFNSSCYTFFFLSFCLSLFSAILVLCCVVRDGVHAFDEWGQLWVTAVRRTACFCIAQMKRKRFHRTQPVRHAWAQHTHTHTVDKTVYYWHWARCDLRQHDSWTNIINMGSMALTRNRKWQRQQYTHSTLCQHFVDFIQNTWKRAGLGAFNKRRMANSSMK